MLIVFTAYIQMGYLIHCLGPVLVRVCDEVEEIVALDDEPPPLPPAAERRLGPVAVFGCKKQINDRIRVRKMRELRSLIV